MEESNHEYSLVKSTYVDFMEETKIDDTATSNTGGSTQNQTPDDTAIIDSGTDFDWDTFDWEIVESTLL